MFEVYLWFYLGCFLMVLGALATAVGPGVKDPIVRTFNAEVAAFGISLIFLAYNHTLALLTFVAATSFLTLILLRAIMRLEEMGAEA